MAKKRVTQTTTRDLTTGKTSSKVTTSREKTSVSFMEIFIVLALFFGSNLLALFNYNFLNRDKSYLYQQKKVINVIDNHIGDFMTMEMNNGYLVSYSGNEQSSLNMHINDLEFLSYPVINYTVTFYISSIKNLDNINTIGFVLADNANRLVDVFEIDLDELNSWDTWGYFSYEFEFIPFEAPNSHNLKLNVVFNADSAASFIFDYSINQGHTIVNGVNNHAFQNDEPRFNFYNVNEMESIGDRILMPNAFQQGLSTVSYFTDLMGKGANWLNKLVGGSVGVYKTYRDYVVEWLSEQFQKIPLPKVPWFS